MGAYVASSGAGGGAELSQAALLRLCALCALAPSSAAASSLAPALRLATLLREVSSSLFCFVLFCFVLFCFVLFCFSGVDSACGAGCLAGGARRECARAAAL
jgi:hypothetical protein